jgi:uncharacterized protein YunC (DUF1805 family)
LAQYLIGKTAIEYIALMYNDLADRIYPIAFVNILMPLPKRLLLTVILSSAALQGCTVIAIADTVGTLAVRTVGVAAGTAVSAASAAADVSIATTKIGVKVVGAVVDAAIPDK